MSTQSSPILIFTDPRVAGVMPATILDVVVLPAPDFPTRPNTSRSIISKVTPSTALTTPLTTEKKCFSASLSDIIGSPRSAAFVLSNEYPSINLSAIFFGSPCISTLPESSHMASSAILSTASGQWDAKTIEMPFLST